MHTRKLFRQFPNSHGNFVLIIFGSTHLKMTIITPCNYKYFLNLLPLKRTIQTMDKMCTLGTLYMYTIINNTMILSPTKA